MNTQSINDQLELLRLKELFMSNIDIRSQMALMCSRGFEEQPRFHSLCEFTKCEPHVAEMFAQLLLIDVMLTPEEIEAERERLERIRHDYVRYDRFCTLLKLVENTDEIVKILSTTCFPEVTEKLMSLYDLTEEQVGYIMDVSVEELTQLDRKYIESKCNYYRNKLQIDD